MKLLNPVTSPYASNNSYGQIMRNKRFLNSRNKKVKRQRKWLKVEIQNRKDNNNFPRESFKFVAVKLLNKRDT